MHAPEWASLRHILAIRLDNIGDVVLLAPALKAIKTTASRARLTLMATPAGSQVAPLIEAVDDVIVERPVWQDTSGAYPSDYPSSRVHDTPRPPAASILAVPSRLRISARRGRVHFRIRSFGGGHP